jgi:hypothetical protein
MERDDFLAAVNIPGLDQRTLDEKPIKIMPSSSIEGLCSITVLQ